MCKYLFVINFYIKIPKDEKRENKTTFTHTQTYKTFINVMFEAIICKQTSALIYCTYVQYIHNIQNVVWQWGEHINNGIISSFTFKHKTSLLFLLLALKTCITWMY